MLYITPRRNIAVRLAQVVAGTIVGIVSATIAAGADRRVLESLRDAQLEELGLRRRPDGTIASLDGKRR